MTLARYRLYREHKFVTFMLSNFSRDVAKADFSDNGIVAKIKEQLSGIIGLMNGHAEHENKRIHLLLKEKNSPLYEQIETDHAGHAGIFSSLETLLEKIQSSTERNDKILFGHQFYLTFQQFEGQNLLHQVQEEMVLMPELQRLYTDEELLNAVEAKTYQAMTVDQMVHMMQVLFPQFNPDDREAFLRDIHLSQPEKFLEAWSDIAPSIAEDERQRLMTIFRIQADMTKEKDAPTAQKLYYSWEQMPADGSGERVKTTYDLEREVAAAAMTTVSDKSAAMWRPAEVNPGTPTEEPRHLSTPE